MVEPIDPDKPIDEVMLAMDVVDTLRHRSKLVTRELNEEGKEKGLIKRLKEIYAAQGIDVPDYILAEGVNALKEDRFSYSPTPPSLSRKLAEIYVTRNKWGKPVLLVIGLLVSLFALHYTFVTLPEKREAAKAVVELEQTLPASFNALYQEAETLTDDVITLGQANAIKGDGLIAVKAKDIDKARAKEQALRYMVTMLGQAYDLRIISKPGEYSGVWRIPNDNPNARNYYVIVEPVDSIGDVVSVALVNEENNARENVKKFGVRVSKSDFEKVQRDKADDGIIQGNIIGRKMRGKLQPDYIIPAIGGVITEW